MSYLMMRSREEQNVAHDPLVWCDCLRDTLPLSLKVAGVGCAQCRRDAGETVLTPGERAALDAQLQRLARVFEAAESEADRHHAAASEAEVRAEEAGREMDEIRARLEADR